MILPREHPRRRSLKDGEAGDVRRDPGNKLDAARPSADHSDPSAGQVDVMPPAGRVQHGSGEGIQSGKPRHAWNVDAPDGRDDSAGAKLAAIGCQKLPQLPSLVPLHPDDCRPCLDMRDHTMPLGDKLYVVENLGMSGILSGPIRFRCERVGVEVRGHVAAASWVGVVAPGATDGVFLVKDDKVRAALIPQADRHAQATKSCTDDRDADHFRGRSLGGGEGPRFLFRAVPASCQPGMCGERNPRGISLLTERRG